MKTITIFISFFLLFSCSNTSRIIDKPIIFNKQREQLTLEYLLNRYNLKQENSTITPKIIVLHWTQIPTFQKSFNAFNEVTLPNFRSEINAASGLNVSAHFLVDQDGTIYRLMPETTMARHVIGLNHCAIGIENVGGDKETPLTKNQIDANIWLVNYLAKKYDIEYLIGHYQYTNFEGHKLWLEKDAGYRTVKEDPGATFLNEVTKATLNLKFKKNPPKKI